MKSQSDGVIYYGVESHPTWVRGLKYEVVAARHPVQVVAPHVGAWIEMPKTSCLTLPAMVAPHVGAWIEIVKLPVGSLLRGSHPTWVRGLKSR